jgi:hypothetical protein
MFSQILQTGFSYASGAMSFWHLAFGIGIGTLALHVLQVRIKDFKKSVKMCTLYLIAFRLFFNQIYEEPV